MHLKVASNRTFFLFFSLDWDGIDDKSLKNIYPRLKLVIFDDFLFFTAIRDLLVYLVNRLSKNRPAVAGDISTS